MTARRTWWRPALLLLSGVVILFVWQGTAMAKMVLFSPVHGTVTLGGKPVAGAQVDREFRWGWKDEKATESTKTDAAGRFKFGLIERSSFFGGILPHEISIQQAIFIRHGGATYKAWLLNKQNYDLNGEIGRPINIVCRLEAEIKHSGDVYGICDIV